MSQHQSPSRRPQRRRSDTSLSSSQPQRPLPHSPRWRAVPGFEDWYKISDDGCVVSTPHVSFAGAKQRTVYERQLKVTKVVRKGKLEAGVVTLSHPYLAQSFSIPITRLVLISFKGLPTDESMIALTRDGDPLNAKLSNLRWGTFQDAPRRDAHTLPSRRPSRSRRPSPSADS